jgi:protein-S-isoprenylcysteine O-methyltransferase Ste14
MLAGLAATLRAQVEMGRSWRIGVDAGEKTELVTEGMFAWSRNPIFASMVAVASGTALAVPGPGPVLGAGMLLAGVEAQVRLVEEPYLLRVHGERYRRYAGRTGRFVPLVGSLRSFRGAPGCNVR